MLHTQHLTLTHEKMQKDNEARVCDNKILEQVSVAHKSLTVQLPGLCFIRML
jgi:hypothetical protein